MNIFAHEHSRTNANNKRNKKREEKEEKWSSQRFLPPPCHFIILRWKSMRSVSRNFTSLEEEHSSRSSGSSNRNPPPPFIFILATSIDFARLSCSHIDSHIDGIGVEGGCRRRSWESRFHSPAALAIRQGIWQVNTAPPVQINQDGDVKPVFD